MTTIRENISEYRRSCEGVRSRIDQLTGLISGTTTQPTGESVKNLEARRYQLYCELAEMEQHIRFLQEYLDCTEEYPQACTG